MPTDTNEENPTMLEGMAGENETHYGRAVALLVRLLIAVMDLGPQAAKMTLRKAGVTNKSRDIMGVLEAHRMATLMDMSLNKATLDDLVFHVRDSGIDKLVAIDDNGKVRELVIGSSSYIDRVLDSRDGRRAVGALMALRKVRMLDAARLDALRHSLATDTEELEEGYVPASPAVLRAFGLDDGSVVRYVGLEKAVLSSGDLDMEQGLQQYATQGHLNINAETVLDWFKGCVDANAYYCATCSKNRLRGTRDNGRPVPVNWSAPAVLDRKVSARVAAKWGISEDKTGSRRCPTCDTPAYALSHNGNTAHLPLLTFNGATCEGVATVASVVRAVSFRMDKESFKVVQRAAMDKATPTDAVRALMTAQINYRVKGKEFALGRLVPVWWHHVGNDGAHTDRLGLAIEPAAHAGGHGDLNG